jgi:hypothetical protein
MVGLAGAVATPVRAGAATGHTAFVLARSMPVAQNALERPIDVVGESLYRVDLTTGHATLVGSLNLTAGYTMSSLAFASDGTLYGIADTPAHNIDASADFYRVNTTTGASTLVGSLGTRLAASGLAFGSTGTLWYSGLFAAQSMPVWQFGRIDKATGAATATLAPTNLPLSTVGLATGCDGTIFGVSTPNATTEGTFSFVLSRINTATGMPSEIGPLGFTTPSPPNGPPVGPPDLAVDHASGTMYAVHTDLTYLTLPPIPTPPATGPPITSPAFFPVIKDVRLLTVDPATGAATAQSTITVDGNPLRAAVDAIAVDPVSACTALAVTGVNTAPMTAAGLGLAALGALLILVAARRRRVF